MSSVVDGDRPASQLAEIHAVVHLVELARETRESRGQLVAPIRQGERAREAEYEFARYMEGEGRIICEAFLQDAAEPGYSVEMREVRPGGSIELVLVVAATVQLLADFGGAVAAVQKLADYTRDVLRFLLRGWADAEFVTTRVVWLTLLSQGGAPMPAPRPRLEIQFKRELGIWLLLLTGWSVALFVGILAALRHI